jgi:hypothetical protein
MGTKANKELFLELWDVDTNERFFLTMKDPSPLRTRQIPRSFFVKGIKSNSIFNIMLDTIDWEWDYAYGTVKTIKEE